MEEYKTNYLNLYALTKAAKNDTLREELQQQCQTKPNELSAESYCLELLQMKKNSRSGKLSEKDIIRKEFHSNY